jgi:hypothetical protein
MFLFLILATGTFKLKSVLKVLIHCWKIYQPSKTFFIWKERIAAGRPSDQNFLEIGKKLPQMSVLDHSLLN